MEMTGNAPLTKCVTEDCTGKADRRIEGKPACQACYRRYKRGGSTAKKRRTPKPPMSWDVISDNSALKADTGCLLWEESTDKDGFPRYYDSAKYAAGESNSLVYVRRWILEQLGNKMGRRYIAEDICGNRLCVEKTHLVVATYSTSKNMLAGMNARKTECVNGHPFTPENTYIAEGSKRQCKQCRWAAAMRHQGKNPDLLVRGIPNGEKEYCTRGHVYSGDNLYTDGQGNRHCRECNRINHLRRKYGLTPEEYEDIREKQEHRCAICLTDFNDVPEKQIVVDHCHVSEQEGRLKVRGILCQHCNLALGGFRDNVESLKRAIRYLSNP